MAYAILLARGAGGDVNPFIALGHAIRLRGHEVTLLTHSVYREVAEGAELDFLPLETPEEFQKIVAEVHLAKTPHGSLALLQRHIFPRAVAEYEQISALCRKRNAILIARQSPFAEIVPRLVAERQAVPLVTLFIAPNEVATLRWNEQLVESLLGSSILEITRQLGLPPIRNWVEWVQRSSRIIAPWPDWFDPPGTDWPPEATAIGFLASYESSPTEPTKEAEDILRQGPAPVLIASGLGPFMGKEFYLAAAEACGSLERPALLVTRYPALLPERLPPNVFWFPYLPFSKIMPRSAAVIHHGGIGTLGQAFAAGIPQLALAVGSDRPYNAACLQRLGVGEFLPPPQWQPSNIAEALRRLLTTSAVSDRCREFAQRIRRSQPLEAVCEIVESLWASHDSLTKSTPALQDDSSPESLPAEYQTTSGDTDLRARLRRLSPEKRSLLERRLKMD